MQEQNNKQIARTRKINFSPIGLLDHKVKVIVDITQVSDYLLEPNMIIFATSKNLRPACISIQSDQDLYRLLTYFKFSY
jgi:hypothetical protein